MTENKRFSIGMLKTYVNDNEKNYCYSLELPTEANHLCNLLNELHEENQQLKKEVTFFQKELRDCSWKSRELTLSQVEDAIEKIKRYE